tara:strand:- start:16 stop:261 length:246 start_codon:yes stop_codon:yes gene_type:complete
LLKQPVDLSSQFDLVAVVDHHVVGHRPAFRVISLSGHAGRSVLDRHAATHQPSQANLKVGLDDNYLAVTPTIGETTEVALH